MPRRTLTPRHRDLLVALLGVAERVPAIPEAVERECPGTVKSVARELADLCGILERATDVHVDLEREDLDAVEGRRGSRR